MTPGDGPRSSVLGPRFPESRTINVHRFVTIFLLLLVTIGQRWSLDLASSHRVRLQPVITLRPGDGMPMAVRSRSR